MLNQLSNAQAASHLPASLLPAMRKILYLGYHNIMVTALGLIVFALILVITIELIQKTQ